MNEEDLRAKKLIIEYLHNNGSNIEKAVEEFTKIAMLKKITMPIIVSGIKAKTISLECPFCLDHQVAGFQKNYVCLNCGSEFDKNLCFKNFLKFLSFGEHDFVYSRNNKGVEITNGL